MICEPCVVARSVSRNKEWAKAFHEVCVFPRQCECDHSIEDNKDA